MRSYALTCEALANLDRTQGKVQCAAAYLSSRSGNELAVAARFLSGSPLPPGTEAPQVGGASIVRLVAERADIEASRLRRKATRLGDLGEAVAATLAARPSNSGAKLTLLEVADTLARLGRVGASQRSHRLEALFSRADALEAKYLTKLLVGSLRIGMQAARVEEAVVLAFQQPPESVRRAHMLLGDIGLVATRAAEGRLGEVRLRPFRPVRSMLAYPIDTPEEILDSMSVPVIGEDKYDGVRAQLHLAEGRRRLYSRGLEDCTYLYPELADVTNVLSGDWILDGEVLAWRDGPLPFASLQRRLGRREVPLTLLLDVPIVYVAFDVLQANGEDLVDVPLRQRKELLLDLPEDGPLRPAPARVVDNLEDVQRLYDQAIERGNEGAVFKDPDSPYRPGTRGRSWIKLKAPLATLDVAVTAAEYGHGKRAGLLSDVTFAVRGPEGLLDIGKAYSGLTDVEILELTDHFKATTVSRREVTHEVEPSVVLEVAFGGIQRSRRHPSGYALRFPRIVRRRTDIDVDSIDTLERVAKIHGEQGHRGQAG